MRASDGCLSLILPKSEPIGLGSDPFEVLIEQILYVESFLNIYFFRIQMYVQRSRDTRAREYFDQKKLKKLKIRAKASRLTSPSRLRTKKPENQKETENVVHCLQDLFGTPGLPGPGPQTVLALLYLGIHHFLPLLLCPHQDDGP